MNQKTIRIRMTARRAAEYGRSATRDLVMVPCPIDLDALTPTARWIAEHITATYIADELLDRIDFVALSGESMMQRDMRNWQYDINPDFRERVASFAETYGEDYTSNPMCINDISFPIFGSAYARPEDVIEQTARDLAEAGAVTLKSIRNDDVYSMV